MIEPDIVLPSQHLRRTLATPEKRLLLAVLEEAVGTYRRYVVATDRQGLAILADVEAWFASEDAARLCAFVAICHTLEIEPTYVRSGLSLRGSTRRTPTAVATRGPLYSLPFRRVSGRRHRVTGRAEGMSREA